MAPDAILDLLSHFVLELQQDDHKLNTDFNQLVRDANESSLKQLMAPAAGQAKEFSTLLLRTHGSNSAKRAGSHKHHTRRSLGYPTLLVFFLQSQV
jgi:DNA anti-recombination protein RmuC